MPRFISKQVEIEAYQIIDEENDHTVETPRWLIDAILADKVKLIVESATVPGRKTFTVHTDEGIMEGQVGDWIIKGLEGELYPCRDSIFKAKYDLIK